MVFMGNAVMGDKSNDDVGIRVWVADLEPGV